MDIRREAIFSCTDWPGGVYATPTYAGSRPGANIAVCLATLNKIGYSGDVERTAAVLKRVKITSLEVLYMIKRKLYLHLNPCLDCIDEIKRRNQKNRTFRSHGEPGWISRCLHIE